MQPVLAIWERLNRLSHVCAVEVSLARDGATFDWCELQRKGASISHKSTHTAVRDFDELTSILPKEAAVVLVLSGMGVLHQKVENGSEESPDRLLRQVLPNADPEEFLIRTCPLIEGQMVSVCRRELVREWSARFTAGGFPVIEVSVGPAPFQLLLSELPGTNSDLQLGHHNLTWKNHQLVDYRWTPSPALTQGISIGGESVPGELALAFASGLMAFMSPTADFEEMTRARLELTWRNLFRTSLWAILLLFFFLAAGSFFLDDHYKKELADLEETFSLTESGMDRLDDLEQELETTEKALAGLGVLSPSRCSFYADRIGAGVPKSVHLTGLEVNPVQEERKAGKKHMRFATNQLIVEGSIPESSQMVPWIKSLEKEEWTSDVELQQYNQNHETGTGEFRLILTLK